MNTFGADIVRYLIGAFACFLPPRYRPELDRGHGILSGIIETMFALFTLIFRAIAWIQPMTEVDIRTATVIGGTGGMQGVPGSGIFLLAAFWMNPLHLAIVYFVLEGVVRALAALAAHQIIGTAPLYLISACHNRLSRKAHEASLGPLVVDEIIRGGPRQDYGLTVYSCRPKPNWNPYMTVEFEGEFYQFVREEYGSRPRRFIYYLRKNPIGRSVVVVDHYRIDSVLKFEPDKWAGTSTVWDKLFPNWNRPPIVPDEIVRGSREYDLKIHSCRPKRDWNAHVTIEFEEQRYQLVKNERGPKPRPYIYYLRKAGMTRPAMVIRRYPE